MTKLGTRSAPVTSLGSQFGQEYLLRFMVTRMLLTCLLSLEPVFQFKLYHGTSTSCVEVIVALEVPIRNLGKPSTMS